MTAAPGTAAPVSPSYPTPKRGVPFLDAFGLTHGPVSLLGRLFLIIGDRLRRQGLQLEFASFEEVAELRRCNVANWSFFNPMFDPALADIPEDRAFCLVVRDTSRRIVATGSAKLIDASQRSLAEIVDAGDFYAIRPADNPTRIEARMFAPAARTMYGDLAFCGGIWVDPAVRGLRLAALVGRLVNASMLTLWNPDVLLGLVRMEAADTNYRRRYGYTHTAPSLMVYQNGEPLSDATLLWMTADDSAIELAHFLDDLWPQIDAAVVGGRREKSA